MLGIAAARGRAAARSRIYTPLNDFLDLDSLGAVDVAICALPASGCSL